MGKVIVIGLDGATFELIKPWVKEGKLPNLAKLMQEGSYGELKSTPEKISPAAWTSFSTGKNPGKHGIYHFTAMDTSALKLRVINATCRDGNPIWSYLSNAEKSVCVINVPFTFPADKVNGLMISGWDSPSIDSAGFTYPANLLDELLEKFKEFPITPTIKKYTTDSHPDLAIGDIHHLLDFRTMLSRYLQKKNKWDFFITVYTATDEVQHHFWHHMDKRHMLYNPDKARLYGSAIFDVYQKCDQAVGELLTDADEDTTIVIMSDHGATINSLGVIYLPLWLHQLGLAKRMNILKDFIRSPSIKNGKNIFRRIKGMLYFQISSLLSDKSKQFLKRLLGGKRSGFEAVSEFELSKYDWLQTRAYEAGPNIRINLKGREIHGIVSPGEEYEKLRDYIIAKLHESRDMVTGKKIVTNVYKREDVYHGKHVEDAPDLIVDWAADFVIRGISCLNGNGEHVKIKSLGLYRGLWSGEHSNYGIFIAKGPHIKKGNELKDAEIIDITPSLLYLMGLPIPEDMDGKVLTHIFEENFVQKKPVGYTQADDSGADIPGDSYTDEEARKVEERLKNLGYL
ncbi:MAG: alkaline phosphatase family protein [Candidatus Schekmanbacteria bacterium]|nr:alkaline phosphatase family protein [Candidatus Schekmanbacteria bacterium]